MLIYFNSFCVKFVTTRHYTESGIFSVNGQATKRRSSHTSGQATRTVEPLHFGNTITRMVIPHIRMPSVFPSQKNRMASIKNFICEVPASVKAKFDGSNLPTDELNNFIGERFLFYKGNLIIENTSGNKHVTQSDIAFGYK